MKKFYLPLCTLILMSTVSACSSQTSAAPPSEAPATSVMESLPSIAPYEPVADEAQALAQLTEQEIATYHDILCSGSSFAELEDIATIDSMTQEEKIQTVRSINDAPAIVRQISDNNKNLTGSEGNLQKPRPTVCN